jgi:hypothetical protein
MGPKGYPASVLFYFAIAISFLAVGRVALRARDSARTSPSSIESPQRANLVVLAPDVASSQRLTVDLKPRPPSLTTPKFQPSAPAESFLSPQPFATPLLQPATRSVPANFSLPITFEPAAASAEQTVQYVGRGKGMTVLLESGGIEIAVATAPGTTVPSSTVKLRLVKSAAMQATASGPPSNASPSAPQRRRKRRPSTHSTPRTRRAPNRRNRPRRILPVTPDKRPAGNIRLGSVSRARPNPAGSGKPRREPKQPTTKVSRGKPRTPSAVRAIIFWAAIPRSGAPT